MAQDYYDILGVSKTASKDEIKKAFHKLAHKYHPDKKDGDEKKFKEANEAYQTLSDDQKRAQYDQFGSAGPQGFGGGGWSGAGGFGGFDFSQGGFQGGFGDMGDLNDIFSEFFGGGGGRARAQRGRDVSTEITIPFKDSIFGTTRHILITKQSACDECHGSGAQSGSKLDTCETCGGKGQLRETRRTVFGTIANNITCTTCHGKGKVPKEKCHTCKGSGVHKGQKEIKVDVPAGINSGEMLRMSGMGEAISGGEPGDLYIRVNITNDSKYRREGSNLATDLHIKLTDALLGAKHSIATLDGDVTITIPEGITHGELLRIKERGVPNGRGKRGDILVRILIDMPKKLSRKEKELIEELKKEGM